MANYWVDSDGGNDAGTGAIGDPWQTIDHAITTAAAGDTVYLVQSPVRQFPEGMNLNAGDGGNVGNPILVISEDIDDPTIVSTIDEWDFNGVDYITFQHIIFDDCERWELGNLTYPGGQCATGITVQHCIFRHWEGEDNGIYAFQTDEFLVEDCHFVDCRSRVVGNDFTMIRLAGRTTDCTIRRSAFEDIGSDGITLCGNFDTHPAIVDAIDVLIEDCCFWINRPYGSRSWQDFSSNIGENGIDVKYVPTGPVTVRNCVIHGYRAVVAGQDASGADGPATVVHMDANNITYVDCRIYDCCYGIKFIIGTKGETGSSDLYVKNCCIHDMADIGRGTGIYADHVDGLTIEQTTVENCTRYLEITNCTLTSVKNNMFIDGSYNRGGNAGEGNFDWNGWRVDVGPPAAWVGANDPAIVAMDLNDQLEPGPSSDLLDAGTNLGYSFDLAGRARDATPAIGCFEMPTTTELVHHDLIQLYEEDLSDTQVDAEHEICIHPGEQADLHRLGIYIFDTTAHYYEWDLADEKGLSLTFYIEPRFLTMANNDVLVVARFEDGGNGMGYVELRYNAGFYIVVSIENDAGVRQYVGSSNGFALGDIERHKVQADFKCAVNPGDNDGYARLLIDDVLQDVTGGIDNDTLAIDSFRIGAMIIPATTGGAEPTEVFFVDTIILDELEDGGNGNGNGGGAPAVTVAGTVALPLIVVDPPAYEIWLTDDYGLRLSDRDGRTLLDNIHSLRCTRVVNGIGWFKLIVPRFFDPTLLRPDYMVQVWRKPRGGTLGLWRVYFLRKWRFQTESGEKFINLEGPCLNDLLRRRIVAHYSGSDESGKTDYADDMMKEVVTESETDGTNPAPTAGTRVWADLTVAPDVSAGPSITVSFPWEYLLTTNGGGVLAKIAKAAREAGTEVFFDIVPATVSASAITVQFRTYINQPGADRTVTNTMFSEERGNLEDGFLEYDYSQEQNYIYAGGQGEKDLRNIQQVYDADRYNASQWARCEGFADARNATTDNGVREAGRALLEEGRPRKRIGGQPIDAEGMRFGIDWEWGDKVPARYENEEFDAIIRSVVIEVNEDGEETIRTNRLEYEE